MTGPASDDEARAFARSFGRLLDWLQVGAGSGSREEVVALLHEHLGEGGVRRSVVSRQLPPFEHVNLQAALDAWTAEPRRTCRVQGVALPPHFGGLTLQALLGGEGLPPVRLSAPALVDLPSGPDRTLACLQLALLLVEDDRGRYALFVTGPVRHQEPSLTVEVAGLDVAGAQAVHTELAALRSSLNVYRRQVVELGVDDTGMLRLDFAHLPATAREDVVLPETVLARVERHTVDVARHRDALRAAGQHLKRGLLLYGPPGTGKTHTTR